MKISNEIIIEKGEIKIRDEGVFAREPLSILEALYLSAQEELPLSKKTEEAAFAGRHGLKACPGDKVYDLVCAIITAKEPLSVLLKYPDILVCAVPEIEKSIGFDQRNSHHAYDVWEHTVRALCNIKCDKIPRLIMLLHDLGKPHTFTVDENGTGHFYGHAKKSESLAREFFKRSGEDQQTVDFICRFVYLHDCDLFATPKSIKRWIKKLSVDELMLLIDVKKADSSAQAEKHRNRGVELEKVRRQILDIDEIERLKSC